MIDKPTDSPAVDSTDISTQAASTNTDQAPVTETTSAAAVTPTTAPTQSDLPEWEPLTPELVEDEAIRGDFMLRWAAILLALLLGCRQVAESQTLVRIRTGEYLASHGILPPRTDIFSYTAGDRSWINLAWLFDLLVAGLHALGGPMALSAGVGIATAVLFYWLVNLNRSKLPTWWHAVCAGVLLLPLSSQLVPLPQLITFLGVAWCLRLWVDWIQQRRPRTLWCFVLTLAIWSNLDPRAYYGGLLLLGFGIGTEVMSKLRRETIVSADERRLLWKVIGCGCGALLINPFGWHAWLSPVTRIATELPWLRANAPRVTDLGFHHWQSLVDVVTWRQPSIGLIAAMVLMAMALVTTILNRRRVDGGLLVAVLFVTTMGCASWGDLAPALVGLCVLSALNGQDWYRDHCRQEYTVDWKELLFSRAGRALTVIAFGALAYFAISGRLMDRSGIRVGFGWTPQLAANISGTEKDLHAMTQARLFQFRLDQGDLAIWAGHRVFIDSRVALYARGEPNILSEHETARGALRSSRGSQIADQSDADSQRRQAGREVLHRYEVTHLTPRLWGLQPGYGALIGAFQSEDWQLEQLGATCALFGRKPVSPKPASATANNNEPVAESGSKRLDFVDLAFRQCNPEVTNPARIMWPQAQTGYQRFLSLRPHPVSNAGQRARHYIELLQSSQNGVLSMSQSVALSLCHLAIRDSQAAIFEDNNNIAAYTTLADAYSVLDVIESRICAAYGYPIGAPQRLFQSVAAIHQALVLDPDNPSLRLNLIRKYRAMNRTDSMQTEIEPLIEMLLKKPELSEADVMTVRQLREVSEQVKPALERVEKAILEAREKQTDTFSLALFIQQQGFSNRALSLLEAEKIELAGNLQATLQMALLMSESGRLEEANSMFEGLDQIAGSSDPVSGSWQIQAALVAMARGDYERANTWCLKQRNTLNQTSLEAVLGTASLRSADVPLIAAKSIWPTSLAAASQQVLFNLSDQKALLCWMQAVTRLECGNCNEAKKLLRELLANHPQSAQAPLARVYLELLTNEPQSIIVPGEEVPILFAE